MIKAVAIGTARPIAARPSAAPTRGQGSAIRSRSAKRAIRHAADRRGERQMEDPGAAVEALRCHRVDRCSVRGEIAPAPPRGRDDPFAGPGAEQQRAGVAAGPVGCQGDVAQPDAHRSRPRRHRLGRGAGHRAGRHRQLAPRLLDQPAQFVAERVAAARPRRRGRRGARGRPVALGVRGGEARVERCVQTWRWGPSPPGRRQRVGAVVERRPAARAGEQIAVVRARARPVRERRGPGSAARTGRAERRAGRPGPPRPAAAARARPDRPRPRLP